MTTVSTSLGLLGGREEGGLHVFRGVPFAQPPVGELRFRAPEPPLPWAGVRDATAFGPACIQVGSALFSLSVRGMGETSEDCLFLNVWTPGLGGRRPVMVWIHGGAFLHGAGLSEHTSGEHLAARGDVVVVTINYRLGIFGFLHGRTLCGDSLPSTGNEGILDQVAALEWVHDNIEKFGGDPANVTVFGQSAGATSTSALLSMPRARRLFHKAILQSGPANLFTTTAASAGTARILSAAGLTPESAAELRKLSSEELLSLQISATPRTGVAMSYAPVIDGEVIPQPPLQAIEAGGAAGIPVLIGTNLEEGKFWAPNDPALAELDEAGLTARAEPLAGGAPMELIRAYREARSARGEPVTPFELYEAIFSDRAFRLPAMRLAGLQARHNADVYAYLFNYPSPDGMFGACHTLEIPFVFGTYGQESAKQRVGDGPEVEELSIHMQDAWIAFARSGNPSHPGLPEWPAYDLTRRATMLFEEICKSEDAPRKAEDEAWESVFSRR